jgi:hypothetical protein
MHICLLQGCTKSGRHVTRATKLCMVVPSSCGPSVWNLLLFTLLASGFLESFVNPCFVKCVDFFLSFRAKYYPFMICTFILVWAGITQSVHRLATGWAVQESNPSWDDIFRTRSDQPWGPPSHLYNGYRVFPGG